MQRTPKAIPATQLLTAASTLYTAPPLTEGTINNMSVTNTSGSAVTVTLYRVPAGGTAGAANAFLSSYSLSANQSYVPPQAIGLQLDPGMTLQALASAASAITAMGGVYETSGS